MNTIPIENNDKTFTTNEILAVVPQQQPFRFVDEIISVNNEGIHGKYRFKEDEFFYKGHFPGDPVTPGVIIIECMAQIGLVCLGIYLIKNQGSIDNMRLLFSESNVSFNKVVRPGETVIVKSEKIYWRRNKLKCTVSMYTEQDELIAVGVLSGMFI